jgi:hypothetical protein
VPFDDTVAYDKAFAATLPTFPDTATTGPAMLLAPSTALMSNRDMDDVLLLLMVYTAPVDVTATTRLPYPPTDTNDGDVPPVTVTTDAVHTLPDADASVLRVNFTADPVELTITATVTAGDTGADTHTPVRFPGGTGDASAVQLPPTAPATAIVLPSPTTTTAPSASTKQPRRAPPAGSPAG